VKFLRVFLDCFKGRKPLYKNFFSTVKEKFVTTVKAKGNSIASMKKKFIAAIKVETLLQ